MSSFKEIREKINGVRNIQKVAKAMEMISAAKMYKAKNRMLLCTPYTNAILKVISHITLGQLEYKHDYLVNKNVKCVGYWVVSTDRGLIGSLNINLFRKLLFDIDKWNRSGIHVKLSIIGSKAAVFFSAIHAVEIISCISGIGDSPNLSQLIGIIKVMLQLYDNNQVDRLFLVYNKFINTLSQVPQISQILPIVSISERKFPRENWDYIYESDSKFLLNTILQRYIESQIYQGVIENLVCEQSARMVSMKTAADNGELIVDDLKLFYNKIRQTKVTQELTEIISGASII